MIYVSLLDPETLYTTTKINPVSAKKIASPTEVHPTISKTILTCSRKAKLHPLENGANPTQFISGQQEFGIVPGGMCGPVVPQHSSWNCVIVYDCN